MKVLQTTAFRTTAFGNSRVQAGSLQSFKTFALNGGRDPLRLRFDELLTALESPEDGHASLCRASLSDHHL